MNLTKGTPVGKVRECLLPPGLRGPYPDKQTALNTLRFWVCGFYCSFAKLCPTLWDPMDCSMPSFPVLHHLLAEIHFTVIKGKAFIALVYIGAKYFDPVFTA